MLINEGRQKGLQLFGSFVFDGPDWGVNHPNTTINGPKGWTVDKIVALSHRLEKEHYSVAIDLLMYEDGSISPASFELLKEAAIKLKRTGVPSH